MKDPAFDSFLEDIGLSRKAILAVRSSQRTAAQQELCRVCRKAWEDAWPEYVKRNIGKKIFTDTFRDIARWEEEFERTHGGEPGFDRAEWLSHHLSLSLFELDGLQYQMTGSTEGIFTLRLHIPKGSDISAESVDRSFAAARAFFRQERVRIICSSWLLSEELSALLPDSSRIKALASRFTLTEADYSRRQAEERIFGTLKDDPAEYEAETSLALCARQFLMNGGRLPVASGFLTV